MTTTQIVISVLVTLTIGGAIGSGVTQQLTPTVQVTCPGPPPVTDNDFFKSHPVPLTGGKSYP